MFEPILLDTPNADTQRILNTRKTWLNNNSQELAELKPILESLLSYAEEAFMPGARRFWRKPYASRYQTFNQIFSMADDYFNSYAKRKQDAQYHQDETTKFLNFAFGMVAKISQEPGLMLSQVTPCVAAAGTEHVVALTRDPNSAVSRAVQGYENLLMCLYVTALTINGFNSREFLFLTTLAGGAYYLFFSNQGNPRRPSAIADAVYHDEHLRAKGQQINQIFLPLNLVTRGLTLLGRSANTALGLANTALTQVERRIEPLEDIPEANNQRLLGN